MKRILTTILACSAAAAVADEAQFTLEREINFAPHPTVARITTAATDPAGNVYFTDNGTDNIHLIRNVWTSLGENDEIGNTETLNFFAFVTGNSYAGSTFDNLHFYTGGKLNNNQELSIIIRATPNNIENPTSWGWVERYAPYDLAGPCAVAPGVLALANRANGAVHIYEWGTNDIIEIGGPVVGSGVPGGACAFDPVTNKLYVSGSRGTGTGGTAVTGHIDRFSYNPATKTVTYDGVFYPGKSTVYGAATGGIRYQQIAIDTELRVLSVGITTGASATAGFGLFDLNNTGLGVTPYTEINAFPNRTANSKLGQTFGVKDGKRFLLLNDFVNRGWVFTTSPASVQDWTIY